MFFFFNDTATTEIYTLSLHDALPIFSVVGGPRPPHASHARREPPDGAGVPGRGLFQDDVVPTAQRPADPQPQDPGVGADELRVAGRRAVVAEEEIGRASCRERV